MSIKRTYLHKGKSVKAHMIALIPPITSSFGGTGPLEGHSPFSVYRGEVPMSAYMIPENLVSEEGRRSH